MHLPTSFDDIDASAANRMIDFPLLRPSIYSLRFPDSVVFPCGFFVLQSSSSRPRPISFLLWFLIFDEISLSFWCIHSLLACVHLPSSLGFLSEEGSSLNFCKFHTCKNAFKHFSVSTEKPASCVLCASILVRPSILIFHYSVRSRHLTIFPALIFRANLGNLTSPLGTMNFATVSYTLLV